MSDVTALTCPNCGGSIDITDSQNEITKCPYCGTTLKLPERPQPEPGVESFPNFEVTYAPPALSQKTARHASGWFALAVILAVVGIIIGFVASFSSSGGFFPSLNLEEAVAPVLPAENGYPDLVVLVKQMDDENIHLALLDGKTRQVRWQSSQTFGSDSGGILPIVGGDLIYFIDGVNLLAFQTATGKLAWQQAMTNGVNTSCKNCVRLVDGQVVVLSKDGTLQAFNALSGQPAWNTLLNTSPTELLLAGGQPAVVDQDKDKNNLLLIYDAQTGRVTRQLGTGCETAQAGTNNNPGMEEAYLSPDGQLAYIMYYGWGPDSPACTQQVDLAAGKTVWTMHPKKGQTWPMAWFASEVMVSDEGIFFYEDNTLSLIDARSGELRSLFNEPRYRDVTPLVSLPGRVVVLAIPDYDSDQKELWGIDTASGKKVWTYKMQAKSIIDPWRVRLVSNGLVVVQCLRDSKASLWEALDPMTGASQGSKKITDQDYYFLDDTWTASTAYLKIDNTLYVVDVKTGVVQYTWP